MPGVNRKPNNLRVIGFTGFAKTYENGDRKLTMDSFVKKTVERSENLLPVRRVIQLGLGSLGIEVVWNLSKLIPSVRRHDPVEFVVADFEHKLTMRLSSARNGSRKPALRLTRGEFVTDLIDWPDWFRVSLMPLPEKERKAVSMVNRLLFDRGHTILIQLTDKPVEFPSRPRGIEDRKITHVIAGASQSDPFVLIEDDLICRQGSIEELKSTGCSYWEVPNVAQMVARIVFKFLTSKRFVNETHEELDEIVAMV